MSSRTLSHVTSQYSAQVSNVKFVLDMRFVVNTVLADSAAFDSQFQPDLVELLCIDVCVDGGVGVASTHMS